MKPPWQAIPVAALALGIAVGWFAPSSDDLTILDVGQGDCAVLRHAGVTILIDDGPLRRPGSPESAAVLAALKREGIGDVDLILLSHPDADHVGGTPALLAEFPNARVAISAQFAAQAKMDRDLDAWHVGLNSVFWLPEKATIRLPDCSLQIYCPPVSIRGDDNRGSMFVRVDDGGATADFSGDAPASVEAEALTKGLWQADILHAGHHGSRTSSGEPWLEAVHPSIAVISCGRDNSYGHPHKATLDRLAALSIPVERTDLQGDLRFVPENGHYVSVRLRSHITQQFP